MIRVIYKNNTKTGCLRAIKCENIIEVDKAMEWIAKHDYKLIRVDGLRDEENR